MKINNGLKSIEEIALEYLRSQDTKYIKMGASSDTTVDTKIFEKIILNNNNNSKVFPTQLGATITKGKLIDSSKKQQLMALNKLSPKKLEEETLNYKEFISSTYISRDSIEEKPTKINLKFLRKIQSLNSKNNKLFFHLRYSNIYDGITELYLPLLNNMESATDLKSLIVNCISTLNYYFNHISVFELHKRVNYTLSKFIEDEKICELINFNILLMLFDNVFKQDEKIYNFFNQNTINIIYQNCYFILKKLYTNLMLKLLYNDIYVKENNKYKSTNNILSKSGTNTKFDANNYMLQNEASFGILCLKYVKEFFKDNIKLNKEKIIDNINFNLQEAYKCLSELVNIILTVLNNIHNEKYSNVDSKVNTQNTNEDNINYNYKQFMTILNFFKFINNYFTEKEFEKNIDSETGIKSMPNTSRLNIKKCKSIINLNNDKFKIKKTIRFYETNNNYNSNLSIIYNNQNYKKIQEFSSSYKEIFKPLLLKYKITVPYLPPIDKNKYKYTLVIDLDETLIHYIEEEDKSFIQVRPYVPYFLEEMGKYFELVIFTAAEKEYANFVLDELDKNNSISYKLYRRHTKYKNGIFLKDLSKIGRELNKICIIDNNKANYSLQPCNGINISSFMGEQNDEELLFLSCQLMKIIDSNKKDIRPIIKEIDENMNNRYLNNNYRNHSTIK